MKFTGQDKRLTLGVIGIVLLAFILFLTLPSLVDKKAIEGELKGMFKQVTGLDLEIQDGMEVSIFPVPHVNIRNLYVSNVPGAANSFLLSIHNMSVKLRPSSLFSAHPVPEFISVSGVDVELEKLKNGRMNWQELAQLSGAATATRVTTADADDALSNSLSALLAVLPRISSIEVKDAEVHFIDSQLGVTTDYNDINLKLNNDSQHSLLEARMNFADLPISFTADMGPLKEVLSKRSTPAKMRLESAQTFLNYEGEVSYTDMLKLQGKTNFESKNLTQWIRVLNGLGLSTDKPSNVPAFPVTMASDVMTDGPRILFPSITVGGGVMEGTLSGSLKLPLTWDIKGELSTLNLDAITESGAFNTGKTIKKTGKAPTTQEEDNTPAMLSFANKRSLWSYITLSVNVKSNNVDFNKNHLKNGHLEFDMSDGEMTISQVSAAFPGNSKMLFTGIGKEGYQGFMLDGQLDASGENLVELTSVFRPGQETPLLPPDFKRFRLKSNMVFSSHELRFTELSARVENMAVVGGVITVFGERNRVQTALRIGGIDLDRFINLWGISKLGENITSETIGNIKSDDMIISWLKNLTYDLDARASLEQYILHGKQMDKFKFRASATKNKMSISELDVSMGESQINGGIAIDVSKMLPSVDMDISIDTLDVAPYLGENSILFDGTSTASAPTLDNPATNSLGMRNWSHKGFNFQWLEHLNASLRIKIGQLKNGSFEAVGIDMRGVVDERTLSITTLSMQIKGSQFSGKGVLKGGKIPSFFFNGDVIGLEVQSLVEFMPVLRGMSGKYNSHFRLNTSGIDIYTWVYNLEGNVTVAARDITVEGFNLPGIVSAVAYVRKVADILDAVKRAYPGGDTLFSTVDGEWTIANGVLKVPAIKLKNEFADGEFTGQIDVLNWKMAARLNLNLTYLDRTEPPRMSITYSGNLDSVEKELSTTHLEQYVANKTSEKLLQQSYPGN